MPSATQSIFHLQGDKELIRTLDRLAASAVRRIVRPAVSRALVPLNKAMKRRAPVESGALKRSLGRKVKSYPRLGIVWGAVGPRSGYAVRFQGRNRDPRYYAHLVEFGTAPHSMGEATKAHGEKHIHRRAKLLAKAQKSGGRTHPGTPARPFARPAFDEARGAMETILNEQIRVNLAKWIEKEASKS